MSLQINLKEAKYYPVEGLAELPVNFIKNKFQK